MCFVCTCVLVRGFPTFFFSFLFPLFFFRCSLQSDKKDNNKLNVTVFPSSGPLFACVLPLSKIILWFFMCVFFFVCVNTSRLGMEKELRYFVLFKSTNVQCAEEKRRRMNSEVIFLFDFGFALGVSWASTYFISRKQIEGIVSFHSIVCIFNPNLIVSLKTMKIAHNSLCVIFIQVLDIS